MSCSVTAAPRARAGWWAGARSTRPRPSRAAARRSGPSAAVSRLDLELAHHPHVLVLDVVAVEDVAEPIARPRNFPGVLELDENPRLPGDIAADEHRVFAPLLEHRRPLAVARQDEEVAHMNVHGVDPDAGRFENPDLWLAGPGPGVDAGAVEGLFVDWPRVVGAVELEPALDPDLRKQLRGTFGHRQKDPGHPARIPDGVLDPSACDRRSRAAASAGQGDRE